MKTIGLGPLSYEAQRGILNAWMWARQKKDKFGMRGGPNESLRWIDGHERIADMAAHLPQMRLVYVADREADLMPLMLRAQELGLPTAWYALRTPCAN